MDGDNPSLPVQPSVSRWRKFRPHLPAALICVAMIAVYLWPDQRQVFIVYLFAVPALALLGLVNLGLIVFRPRQRGWRTLNLLLVAATCVGLIALSDFTTRRGRDAARHDAEMVRKQVESYRARTGAWPHDLPEAGVDAALISKHRFSLDALEDGVRLEYRDIYDNGFMSVGVYTYDFGRGRWVHWREKDE